MIFGKGSETSHSLFVKPRTTLVECGRCGKRANPERPAVL
jgi:hypothetical protein